MVERYGSEGSSRKSILEDLPDSPPDGKPYIAVPIIYGDHLLGVIRCLGKQQIEHFSQDDEDLLKTISDALALCIMHFWNIEAMIQRDEWQSSFMRQASHQLQGPVSNLRHAIELYEMELQDIAGKDSALSEAIADVPRLEKLVTGLLNYAKVEGDLSRLKRTRVNVSSIVRQEVQGLGQNIPIRIIPFAEKLEVSADSGLLGQCINNILSNAIRFSPEGKEIRVSITKAKAIEGPEGYLVNIVDDTTEVPDYNSTVVISLTNEGHPIPKEQQAQIFEEFVSVGAGKVSRSTGFGLTIARKIARSYGGNITVVSPIIDDRGATFNILLPIAE